MFICRSVLDYTKFRGKITHMAYVMLVAYSRSPVGISHIGKSSELYDYLHSSWGIVAD